MANPAYSVGSSVDAGGDRGFADVDRPRQDAALPFASCPPWLDPLSTGRMLVVPQETTPGPSAITFDHAALIAAGASGPDGRDLQVARWDGAAWTPLPFFVDERRGLARADTTLWIEAGTSTGGSLYLYTGGSGSGGATATPVPILDEIQSGVVALNATGPRVVPIRPVDPSRSVAILMTRHAASSPSGSLASIALQPDGTLVLHRSVTQSPAPLITARYLVAEFSNGIRVQHGRTTQEESDFEIPIDDVGSTDRAFVLWSKTVRAEDNHWGPNDPVAVDLTSASSLRVVSNENTLGHTLHWQVITAAVALRVARGRVPFSGMQQADLVIPGADPQRWQALIGYAVKSEGLDVGARMLGAWWNADGTLHLERAPGTTGSQVTDVTWQALSWRDHVVQNGEVLMREGEIRTRVPLARALDPARTLLWTTAQAAAGQSLGSSSFLADDVTGTCSLTLELDASGIIAERSDGRGRCHAGVTAIEFAATFTAKVGPRLGREQACGDEEL